MPRPLLGVGRRGEVTYTRFEPGRWTASAYVRDRDGTRRRVRATGANKTRARMALEDKLERRPSFADHGIGAGTTVAHLVDLWLDERGASGGLAPQTLDRYRTLIENHMKPGIGNLRVGEATTGRIDQFLRQTAKKVPTQARHCRTILSGALAMAARHDAIDANPVRETATIVKKKNEVRALSVEELKELRAAVGRWQDGHDPASGVPVKHVGRPRPTDLLDVVDVLAATGARIGEVLALRWADIDLEAVPPTATISGTLVYVKGQGLIRQDHPKTDAGWRTVALPAFAVETLRRTRGARAPNESDVVFPSAAGTLRSPANFRRQWREARRGTRFEWVTPHSFRKTVATLLDRERTTADAAAQLGHSSPAVTRTHYVQKAHQAPDVTDVLQRLARPVPEPPPVSL
jgi:integrase